MARHTQDDEENSIPKYLTEDRVLKKDKVVIEGIGGSPALGIDAVKKALDGRKTQDQDKKESPREDEKSPHLLVFDPDRFDHD
jgi:glucose-6-phosphate isomerase